jgi:hypothetical protein
MTDTRFHSAGGVRHARANSRINEIEKEQACQTFGCPAR